MLGPNGFLEGWSLRRLMESGRAAHALGASRQLLIATVAALLVVAPMPRLASAAGSGGFDTHQGFDVCGIGPNSVQIHDLCNGTPFWGWGFYMGWAGSSTVGCTATTAFVSTVRGVGFGF